MITTKRTSVLLARASTAEQESFIGRQSGGRVFLFLHMDDFWRDYKEPKVASYGTVAVFEDLYGNLGDLVGPDR